MKTFNKTMRRTDYGAESVFKPNIYTTHVTFQCAIEKLPTRVISTRVTQILHRNEISGEHNSIHY